MQVGGVAAVLLIGGAVWFFLRKRPRQRRNANHEPQDTFEIDEDGEPVNPFTHTPSSSDKIELEPTYVLTLEALTPARNISSWPSSPTQA